MINPSERVVGSEELPAEGASWQNPGEFPPFNGGKSAMEIALDTKRANREKVRSEAEAQYQSELSRPYEESIEREGITEFSTEFDGRKIDGYEFAGSEFKMLVSVIGAVGQSLEGSSREIDLHKWVSSSREYISTSLIPALTIFSANDSVIISNFSTITSLVSG